MRIAGYSIERPLYVWLLMLLCVAGGIWGFLTVGKLEDPSFSIPAAVINTEYPGASAKEVEEEVTERLERAIQELAQIDLIKSTSMPGRSQIEVEIDSSYHSRDFPQIWDELRRKVNDAQIQLPEGTSPSLIDDDFGEVYGLYYAVTTEGFSANEVTELSRFLQRELLTVQNVARVTTAGELEEHIYLDIPQERLNRLGLPLEQLINTIQTENAVEDAGSIRVADQQVRIAGGFDGEGVQHIRSIHVGQPGSVNQLLLGDLATVQRLPAEVPDHLVRFNQKTAFTLAVAGISTANIIEVGDAVAAHLDYLQTRLPIGVEIEPIYQQHNVVDDAINDFFINLAMSVTIVIGVLWLFMGWRIAVSVGATLLLTVLGTLFFMGVFSIEMQRVSLGALLIAMGMLVDNAIVIAEGMLINVEKGMKTKKAANVAAQRTQWPLLGATVIGIMAFSSIGFSDDVTGEFLISLFLVMLISLLLSWLLAITVTPLLSHHLLKNLSHKQNSDADSDPYRGRVYQKYRDILQRTLKVRKITLISLLVLTFICFWAFRFIPQSFFPVSNTPVFFINYELPQGTDIRATERDARRIESVVLAKEGVESVATFIGRGATRFMLTYSPEHPNPAYAQLIVRAHNLDHIDGLISDLRDELEREFVNANIRIQQMSFGPSDGAEVEARFSGPDTQTLRQLASQAEDIMRDSPILTHLRHDWREHTLQLQPHYDEARASQLGVERNELAQTLKFSADGITVGVYREGYNLLPITVRPPYEERNDASLLIDRLIWSNAQQSFVPLAQVVDHFEPHSEENRIIRRNRMRTITVMADSVDGTTSNEAQAAIQERIEGIELEPGYQLEWGGELEGSTDAQRELGKYLPVSLLIMLGITIVLFGRLKQPLIIWAVVPMAVCGVVIGLLLTGLPFSFTAMLGMLSLSGMLMKNAIVLVEEIDYRIEQEDDTSNALLDASVSRLRPVLLAAGTTSLGMLPLLWDPFFASMAVTIIGGLTFASILTLLAVPALYSLMFKIKVS